MIEYFLSAISAQLCFYYIFGRKSQLWQVLNRKHIKPQVMSGIFKKPAIPLSIEQLISFDESELAEIAKEEQQLQNPLSNSKTNKFFSCNMPKAKPAMGFK